VEVGIVVIDNLDDCSVSAAFQCHAYPVWHKSAKTPLCVLNSPSEDGPGIMYIMHIMSPQLQKRKLHQGITKNTLAEAS
jgi:hypothetical protein